MITNEERQSIIDAVLSAIRTNSALITDLTEVQSIPEGSYIELSGGKRIAAATLKTILQTAILDDAVTPTIASEAEARDAADDALSDRLTVVEGATADLEADKFDKSNIVEADGNNSNKVWSQKYATQVKSQLATAIGNISVSITTSDNEKIVLTFTDSQGQSSNLTIGKATAVKAGLLSASDYETLLAHTTAISGLTDKKVVGWEIDSGHNWLSLGVVTVDETAYFIDLPIAGSIPDGYESPVAGIMSAEQAATLEEVDLKVFPLEVNVAGNAGVYEKGRSITPNMALAYTRKGASVPTADVSVLQSTLMYNDSNQFYGDAITENATYNILIEYKGQQITIPAIQYRFFNYVYGIKYTTPMTVAQVANFIFGRMTHTSDPAEVVNDLEELSGRTTYEGHLAAGEMFIFAVPGTVDLVVRHAESGAIIDSNPFTVRLPRQHDTSTMDVYTCIFVPKSDIDWNFKITNS